MTRPHKPNAATHGEHARPVQAQAGHSRESRPAKGYAGQRAASACRHDGRARAPGPRGGPRRPGPRPAACRTALPPSPRSRRRTPPCSTPTASTHPRTETETKSSQREKEETIFSNRWIMLDAGYSNESYAVTLLSKVTQSLSAPAEAAEHRPQPAAALFAPHAVVLRSSSGGRHLVVVATLFAPHAAESGRSGAARTPQQASNASTSRQQQVISSSLIFSPISFQVWFF